MNNKNGVNRNRVLHFLWSRFSLFIVILFFQLVSSDIKAQKSKNDTIVSEFSSVDTAGLGYSKFRRGFVYKWNMQPHSPLKATIYTMALPGAGQIYNGHKKEGSFVRKYWKVPIVYAGIGTCIGFIVFNTEQYNVFKKEYIASVTGGERTMGGTPDQLFQIQEQYHRWMDVSYMALLGVYVLQIIDANVDAHLFYYDVSRDLGLYVHPSVVNTGYVSPALGMTLRF